MTSATKRYSAYDFNAFALHKEPVQVDLFTPYEYGYTFKVIITNKTISAGKLMVYHNERGSQEGIR